MLLGKPLLDYRDASGQFIDGALLGRLRIDQFAVELLARSEDLPIPAI